MKQLIKFSKTMKNIAITFLLVITFSVISKAQNAVNLTKAIRANGNVPGWYILDNSVNVSKLTVPMADSIGNLNIGSYSFPREKLVVAGAVKVGGVTSYTAVTNNSATPVPAGGVGTIFYNTVSNHFFGWIGTAWKQLDN